MSPQVFYRKWRPQTLAEVSGQEPVTQTLLQALVTGRVAHAYLFSGPRGTGKTSTGRILAKAVNCLANGHSEPCNQCAVCQAITQGNSLDVIEVDAASNRGIDEIRSLREKVAFVPGTARYKVYIIDEVHMLTEPAANALLKTLEEPPAHAIFILATTDPHKVPATILSRCQHFEFHRLSQADISARLAYIAEKEGITATPEALRLLARSATGSLRDAENLLEQVVAYYGPRLELGQVKELLGLSGDRRARELVRHIMEKNLSAGLAAIHQANSQGLDLRQFLRSVVDYLRGLLLLKAGSAEVVEVTPEDLAEMKPLTEAASLDSLLRAVKLFSQIDLRLDNYSTLPLELALVECVEVGSERREAGGTPTHPAVPLPAKPPQPIARPAPPLSAPVASAKEKPQPEAVTSPAQPVASPYDHLRQHWREFINSLRGEGSTGTLDALLRNACEPVAIEADTVVLGFYWPLHKEKIEDPKYCFLVERKLNQFLGGSYKLRCVLTEKKRRPASGSGPSPASGSPNKVSESAERTGLSPEPGAGKKSLGHLVDAALQAGGRIVNGEGK